MHKNGTTWKSILLTNLRSVVCGGQTSVSSYAVPVSTRSNDDGDPPSMSSVQSDQSSGFAGRGVWSSCLTFAMYHTGQASCVYLILGTECVQRLVLVLKGRGDHSTLKKLWDGRNRKVECEGINKESRKDDCT